MRWPQGSDAMPCVSCRDIGALCRHPSTSPTPGQRWGLSSPTSSPWVERDFARPHLPKNKSAQTHGKVILSENQRSQKRTPPATSNPYPTQKLIRSIRTCAVSRSERPPLQHASQLPLGTPSEHFSASSRCHTSQKSGCVGPRGPMPCLVCLPLCRFWDHALQAP